MGAFLLLLLQLFVATPVGTTAHASAPKPHPQPVHTISRGADISWPNCPKGEGIPGRRSKGEPLPGHSASFVVLGLTNGPGFYPNPCITDQLSWIRNHRRDLGTYALTTYPSKPEISQFGLSGPYDGTTSRGGVANTAYQEAKYNVQVMKRLGIHVPLVWVDVEPYPTSPWSSSHGSNRAVVKGVMRAYRHAGYRTGIYTYANGWAQVVGGWRLPKVPTWNTVGGDGEKAAAHACSRGPSGGATWLSQWYTPHRDFDLVCPAAPGDAHLFE